MQYTHILLRTGELFLKGKNRQFFEQRLQDNIYRQTGVKIRNIRLRYLCDYFKNHGKLKTVFGLTSYSPCIFVEKDLENIKAAALRMLGKRKGTFRIQSKRSDKSFSISSHELNVLIGSHIEAHSDLKFDPEQPQTIIGIEINQAGAFLFDTTIDCLGGLPTGVEGKVGLLLEDKQSILAGILFLKRGCSLEILTAKPMDCSLLQRFSPLPLRVKTYSQWSEIERYMQQRSLAALVSGQHFSRFKNYPTKALIFRPLIAYSEEQIEQEIKKFTNI